ncbi:MAG: flagellin [Bacteriovoracaceae bacterium]
MGLRINTNVTSLAAQRSLGNTVRDSADVMGKLSSGTRIVRSADDAAGLAISERMRAKIRGTTQAERNANDGISLIQTAEGGLMEVNNILIRLRELAVQSASDTIGDAERKFTDLEYQQLKKEVERISQVTEFNGKKLLNGDGDKYDIQIGVNNDAFQDRISYNAFNVNSTLASLFGGDEAESEAQSLKRDIAEIERDDSFDTEIERIEAIQERRAQYNEKVNNDASGKIAELRVDNKTSAQQSLANIDVAIQKVSGQRAELGAIQNRLGSVISNLQVSNENLSAANSRIRDTDYAAMTAKNAKLNILNAAGTGVLSQANLQGQQALKLIG